MELSAIPWMIQNVGLAAEAGHHRARAERALDHAEDLRHASVINASASESWANEASALRARLIGAEGEIQRLQRVVDELTMERDEVAAIAADLAIENQSLRERLQ
jgi:hypothetical protein